MRIALLFVVTFLIAQLLIRINAHVTLLNWIVRRTRHSPPRLVLGVMVLTFLLSTVVPNLITVLALLPVIQRIVQALSIDDGARSKLLTVLALAVMYAANIGGMASLVGSPANGLALLIMSTHNVVEVQKLTFVSWFAFGFPMASVLLLAAWRVLVVMERSALQVSLAELQFADVAHTTDSAIALAMALIGAGGCVVAGLLGNRFAALPPVALGLTAFDVVFVGLTLVYGITLMALPLPVSKERLLRVADLKNNLPSRGLMFALAALGCGLALEWLGVIDHLSRAAGGLLPQLSMTAAICVLVTVTVFTTELFSNTVTAIGLCTLASAMSLTGGYSAFLPMLGVALASTSAFMSPLATPATGMAFGGLSGVSLKTMLTVGFVVNLLAAAWIAVCMVTWVPWILAIFIPAAS